MTKQEIIEQYLWTYISGIPDGSLTIHDLYDFLMKTKQEQLADIKTWAMPELQARRDKRQAQLDNASAELASMDNDIAEANKL